MNPQLVATSLVIALSAAGCATSTQHTVAANSEQASARVARDQASFHASVENVQKRRIESQNVGRPFIAGNSQPLAREVAMPEMLRRSVPVTALFSRTPVDMLSALQELSQATDLLITATPDALLPSASFSPRTAGTGGGGSASVALSAPPRVLLQAQGTPLWTLLDDIARQTQTAWRPKATGAEFYRVESRAFSISLVPQTANTSAALGRNSGTNPVFESQSKSSFESKDLNVLRGVATAVEAMLTQGGRVVVSTESTTLVVTDTPESLDRVTVFIAEQNKALSRRVRLMLEAIEVVDKDASEMGVDWSVIYQRVNAALNVTAPITLLGKQIGGIGLGATGGRFAGSSVAVNALSEVGVVVNRRVFPLLTTSGRPITQAIRTTFNYVDQVQATSVASSASLVQQAPTITQKDETVGTFLTALPTAKPDGTVFLSLSFDQTTAQPLVSYTVSGGGSSMTVQQKVIDGSGIIQEVPIRSGQSVVVGGFESNVSQDTVRRLAAGAPLILGGSNVAKVTKSRMILVVTAVIEEGV